MKSASICFALATILSHSAREHLFSSFFSKLKRVLISLFSLLGYSFFSVVKLYTGALLIRTGGEVRLSNFLLWQSAYAELYFTDCLWPDFDEAELDRAIASYADRERRFGDVGASGEAEGAVGGFDDVLAASRES